MAATETGRRPSVTHRSPMAAERGSHEAVFSLPAFGIIVMVLPRTMVAYLWGLTRIARGCDATRQVCGACPFPSCLPVRAKGHALKDCAMMERGAAGKARR